MTWEEASGWREQAKEYFEQYGITTLNPLDGKEDLRSLSGLDRQKQFLPQELILRDLRDIDNSDVVLVELAWFDNTYIGTLMEIFYAWEHRKPVIAWTGVNYLHERSWLPGLITKSYSSLDDALDYIVNYWGVGI